MRKRNIAVISAVAIALLLMCWMLLRIGSEKAYVETPTDKVGMILNGSADDQGFSQALHEAAEAVCAARDLKLVSCDGVEGGEPFRALAERLIGEGCTLLLCDSEVYDGDLEALARDYPQICFLNAMGTVKAHNLASCMRRTYQARYLTGIVAGMQTETDNVGFLVSSLSQETIRQLNAFALGVRRANPNATIYVRCTDDRLDEQKTADTAVALLDAHDIDVLSIHAVPVSALKVADCRGVWTIGCSMHGTNPYPNTWLTGYTFNWEPFYAERIDEWRGHRFVGHQYRGGIRNGLVSLAPLSDLVKPGIQDRVDEALAPMMDGSFDVFYGPIRDNYGTLRVREDETLSDDQILHGMSWYAEGVVLE